jgi:hypothetical protein
MVMTKFQVVVLALGLGLVGVSSPDVAFADDNGTRIVPSRPAQQVRQDLRQARHRKGQIAQVPELNAGLATQGVALLVGMTLLIHERRRRTA